jgi:hypothetical protein
MDIRIFDKYEYGHCHRRQTLEIPRQEQNWQGTWLSSPVVARHRTMEG